MHKAEVKTERGPDAARVPADSSTFIGFAFLASNPFGLASESHMKTQLEYRLRMPADPEPFPVQEPPDPPENPDMPVREPDPEDPGQI